MQNERGHYEPTDAELEESEQLRIKEQAELKKYDVGWMTRPKWCIVQQKKSYLIIGMVVIDMITVEAYEKIGDNIVFTLSGNTDVVCNGYKFYHEKKEYRVKSVAMICDKEHVKSDSIDVTVEEVVR